MFERDFWYNMRANLYIAIAFGLYAVGDSLGLRGDAAPLNVGGVSPERLKFHLAGLMCMIGALGFFVAAGVTIYQHVRR